MGGGGGGGGRIGGIRGEGGLDGEGRREERERDLKPGCIN